MSILSPLSVLDNPDPASPADHDALAALVDAPSSPANWLERDYLGAMLVDMDE